MVLRSFSLGNFASSSSIRSGTIFALSQSKWLLAPPARDAPLRACGFVGGLPAEVLLLADLLEAPVALLLGPLLDAVLEVRLDRHHVGRAVYQDGPQEPRVLHLHEEVDYLALAVPVVLPQVVGRHAQRLGDGLTMRVLGVAGPQLVAADGGLGKPRPLRQIELRHPQLLASSPDPRAAGSLHEAFLFVHSRVFIVL